MIIKNDKSHHLLKMHIKKQNIYLYAGHAWLVCCLYQLKNSNTFMAAVSAIISFLLFALSIYK